MAHTVYKAGYKLKLFWGLGHGSKNRTETVHHGSSMPLSSQSAGAALAKLATI